MAQREIIDYMITLRSSGDERYYSAKEIYLLLQEQLQLRHVYRGILALSKSGLLEYDRETLVMDLLNNRTIIKKYRAASSAEKSKLGLKA